MMGRRVHFYAMQDYWSCSVQRWSEITMAIFTKQPFSMDRCRKLETKPKRVYEIKILKEILND